MREKFFKNKISETFPRNYMTSERLGNIDLLSIGRVRADKIDQMISLMNLTVDMTFEGLSCIELITI